MKFMTVDAQPMLTTPSTRPIGNVTELINISRFLQTNHDGSLTVKTKGIYVRSGQVEIPKGKRYFREIGERITIGNISYDSGDNGGSSILFRRKTIVTVKSWLHVNPRERILPESRVYIPANFFSKHNIPFQKFNYFTFLV
jgi:hypothetical protein